jgi:hypothetical protein
VNPARISLVALATVVIFAAGVITGGLLVKKSGRPPPTAPAQPFWGRFEMTRRAVDELDRAGNLTFEQRVRIDQIIRDNQELIAEYFGILEPDVQQLFRKMREDIRAQLTPAQRGRFEELARRRFPNPGGPRRPEVFGDQRGRPVPIPPGEGGVRPQQRENQSPLPPPQAPTTRND